MRAVVIVCPPFKAFTSNNCNEVLTDAFLRQVAKPLIETLEAGSPLALVQTPLDRILQKVHPSHQGYQADWCDFAR